ncbi:glycosylhydrolase-like jelly roll fold domain-containing protein [Devosia nitrariae]|uniref:Alpha-L-rhamnosidase-like protein n=1 Tax=Devosia nitrariae TaxID=2071872 RepID=A0ABQ5W9X8_9HYPH|nr:glycosylhydrolase-like jelly roll fold domain-containing protein [Devosia nitrariae]GLQ56772.1 hypothetical protein GCM10010862_40310 [Devosia nitrariae]
MSKSQVSAALHEGFAVPNPEYSPVPIWWWSGDELALDRMTWQVDQLVSQGVHNAVVLNLAPTGPMYGALSDNPHFLTEEWWALWEGVCDHARKVGMCFWFYDQIGFSGANLQGRLAVKNPAFVGMDLNRVTLDVAGEGEIALPEAGVFVAGQVLPLSADGCVAGEPVNLALEDGVISWRGEGRARLILAYAIRKGYDYHSPEACRALMDIVHHAFEKRLGKYFGSAIVGSFQDELPSVPTWSARFAGEFEKRCGYRLTDKVAALWEDWGLASARIRIDYQRVRAQLAEEALFKPVFDWHEKHGLTIGFDQQSPSRAAQPISTVDQYADYARTHRWYSAPGSDHWGDAKFHSSLAHNYGRPRTWIEAFHSSGWGGTLEETFDWLQPWLLAGANLYDPHAVYYSTRGGQWEWAAPSTCWRQPYWRHYKHFADAVSRLCWLATRGEHQCDIGLLFPSATVQADLFLDSCGQTARAAHGTYQDLVGQMTWFNARSGPLKRLRRDFDVLDDDTVAAARIAEGALHTRGELYKAIIVPAMWMLETATAQKLSAFAEAGGLLIFIDHPPEVADRVEGEAAIATLKALVANGKAQVVAGGAGIEARLEAALATLPAEVVTDSPTLLRRDGDVSMLFITAAAIGAASAEGRLPWAEWGYDTDHISMPRYNRELRESGIGFDLASQRKSATVRIAGPVGAIEQWDPGTGETRPVAVTQLSGITEAEVDFSQSPMTVLVWSTKGEAEAAPARESGRELVLNASWTSRVIPTMDNRHGDFILPASPGPLPVQIWQADWREDAAESPPADVEGWQRVPLTDGVRAWSFGPAQSGKLPAPLPAGHQGELGGEGWQAVDYSLSRGIDHDFQHDKTLGPKGRVLEPMIRLASVAASETVQVRTCLPVETAGSLTLAIGGNGRKEVWWNGVRLAEDTGGYLYMQPVEAKAGLNLLESRVSAVEAGDLEAYWALTSDSEAFARPEWLEPADGWKAGTTLSIRRSLTTQQGDSLVVHFGSIGVARLLVNGHEVAMQGAFEPYEVWRNARVMRYDLTSYLKPGDNLIEARFTDDGKVLAFFLDGVITSPDGGERYLVSDMNWAAEREGTPVELTMRINQRHDARFYWLRPRPHPLPRSNWIDPDAPLEGVLDIVPEPNPGRERVAQWFRLPLPPGARIARLPITGARVTASLGDAELAVADGEVILPAETLAGAQLMVRVLPQDGRLGGAVWEAPVEFDVAEGRIALGAWADNGLEFYSGGLAYEQTLTIEDPSAWTVLDLGGLRGTAEVEVNGQAAGVRVWSPYRFDIAGKLRPGENRLTVTVFNTLAPYLKGASPTRSIFGGQDVSGLFGPVRLC